MPCQQYITGIWWSVFNKKQVESHVYRNLLKGQKIKSWVTLIYSYLFQCFTVFVSALSAEIDFVLTLNSFKNNKMILWVLSVSNQSCVCNQLFPVCLLSFKNVFLFYFWNWDHRGHKKIFYLYWNVSDNFFFMYLCCNRNGEERWY